MTASSFNPRSDATKPRKQPGLGDGIQREKCGAVLMVIGARLGIIIGSDI